MGEPYTKMKTLHTPSKVLEAMDRGYVLQEMPHGACLRNDWAKEEYPVVRRVVRTLADQGAIVREGDVWSKP